MKSPVLIRPSRLKGEPLLPRTSILVLIKDDLEDLRKSAGDPRLAGTRNFFKVYWDGRAGFSLAGPALGAPQAVMVAEKLFALGVENLLFLGWAGSLVSRVRIGDLVLATGALSEEGTSAHYPLESEPGPDPGLIRALTDRAGKNGLGLIPGRIWTTDAVYRETEAKVRAHADRGCVAVDMETSALLTLAAYRKKAAAGILVVSDELGAGKWNPGFKTPAFKKSRLAALNLVLEAAREME